MIELPDPQQIVVIGDGRASRAIVAAVLEQSTTAMHVVVIDEGDRDRDAADVDFRIRRLPGERAVMLSRTRRQVAVRSGDRVDYDVLVLATGGASTDGGPLRARAELAWNAGLPIDDAGRIIVSEDGTTTDARIFAIGSVTAGPGVDPARAASCALRRLAEDRTDRVAPLRDSRGRIEQRIIALRQR